MGGDGVGEREAVRRTLQERKKGDKNGDES